MSVIGFLICFPLTAGMIALRGGKYLPIHLSSVLDVSYRLLNMFPIDRRNDCVERR
nr:MAG TPA: hypothetical protein [Caudoviricetes sp.]